MKILTHYRLQPLLNIKQRAKEKAELILARAIARLEKEKKRLQELKEEKERIIKRQKEARRELFAKVSTGKAIVKDGSFQVNFLKKLEEDEKEKEQQIKTQERVVVDSETEVKRARRDYIAAVKELRILQKHKELWWKKVQLELSRQEEREMDELGNVIHQLKKFNLVPEKRGEIDVG